MTAVYACLFGLAFGSFVNASIDRIRHGVSINGRSRCDACARTLRARELIPIVSYLLLRGRCATCHERIGGRAPAIEAAFGGMFALAFWLLPSVVAVAACAAVSALVIAAGAGAEERGVEP